MRNLQRVTGFVLLGLSLSGCWVTSLNRYIDPKTAVIEKGLVGTWQDAKGEKTAVIEKGSLGAYRIIFVDGKSPGLFTGYLARIGDALFMDITIADTASGNSLYNGCITGTHFLVRLSVDAKRLGYSQINFDWMTRAIASGEVKLEHRVIGKEEPLLLTATTEDLRKFLEANAGNSKAFSEPVELGRIR